jgi:hypothetical protein
MCTNSISNNGLHDLTLIKMIAICFVGTEDSELRILTRSYETKIFRINFKISEYAVGQGLDRCGSG